MFEGSEPFVNALTNIHAQLSKIHAVLSFHSVQEAITSGYVRFYFIPGTKNAWDVLSKHWSHN